MEVARTAGIARVAGIFIPALEKEGYVDIQNFPDAVYGDRTIRLTFIETLKGNPPKRIELTLMHCEGSLSAKVGELVAVYRIHGKWRLDHWPAKPPIRHVPRN